ncbi:MAG TPA: GNAT family N-acetyltransferase [Candidatus Limnocylindrales bacterium]|nr:GNAT family N-acetyltransferase [Candidatus Limnocylindrales bacterium]
MTAAVRPATRRVDDLGTIVAIVNETRPEWSTSVAELRWEDLTYPGATRFIAEVEGVGVGVATVGRIWVQSPDYDALWAAIDVLEPFRCRGIGGALLAAVREVAASLEKAHLHVPATDSRPEAVTFFLHREFAEFERMRVWRLDLAALTPPVVECPAGVELTTLEARPDLLPSIHRVALDAFGDIPGGDEPMAVGDLAEFRARDVERPGIPPDGFTIAVEVATGEAIGYASMIFSGAATTVAHHDMTAVQRSWRGRGVATALKRRTIAWAVERGVGALETSNDEANVGMQRINERLGFRPRPDELVLRGSVAEAIIRP